MAGLLDGGYWGDSTLKDPATGLTQADRRDPLWAGLIQGGMGLLAASQDVTPGQRAQLMGQAGGAYAGIPKAMMDQKTAGAQQVLQAQQVKAGQSKLDAQARLAAMAKTPEFQASVAKLEPEERMLLQAALDAGDMAHATTILSAASRARTATAETARKEARDDAKEAAKAKADAAKEGRYKGTNERLQHLDNLEHEDPGSQKYWAAWTALQQDQKAPDGTIIPKMDLKAAGFSEPTFVPRGGKPPPKPGQPDIDTEIADWSRPAPAPVVVAPGTAITPDVADKIAREMKPDETRVVNGVEFYQDKQGRTEYDTGTDRYRIDAPGKTPTQLPALKFDEKRETTLIKNNTTLNKVDKALKHLRENPNAWLGLKGMAPDQFLQLVDPEGQPVRDLLRDLSGIEIHNRSGASVTAAEEPRLDFLPKKGDTPQIIKQRLESMREYVDTETREAYNTGKREFKMPPAIKERYGKPGGGEEQFEYDVDPNDRTKLIKKPRK